MRISDWSSDVCSSDLQKPAVRIDRVESERRAFEEIGELALFLSHPVEKRMAGRDFGERPRHPAGKRRQRECGHVEPQRSHARLDPPYLDAPRLSLGAPPARQVEPGGRTGRGRTAPTNRL